MFEFCVLISTISDKSRASLVTIGIVAIVGGILMMMRHKVDYDAKFESQKDDRSRLFEKRKFRRRSLASTMLAAMGILMVALNWATEPAAFAGLISLILILLLTIMFLAFLDLMSVSIQTATEDDESARTQMVNEYLRQRKKLLERVDDAETE